MSRTTRVSLYQKGKTNLDFTEAGDSDWQWHQLGHMQVCTLLQTDNHASTPPLSFLQAGCPSCRPANSIEALKACCISSQQANTVTPYASPDAKMHPDRWPWRRGVSHAMAQLALWLIRLWPEA